LNFGNRLIQIRPCNTYRMDPTSPSLIMTLSFWKVTGYMQSTISRICESSSFCRKSLSSIADRINARTLHRQPRQTTCNQTGPVQSRYVYSPIIAFMTVTAATQCLCGGRNYDSTSIRPRYDHSTTYVMTYRPTCSCLGSCSTEAYINK